MPRKLKNKRNILSAFYKLSKKKEYYQITVSEIITLSEVSKTTFYRYYQRKLDLLIEMHAGIFHTMLQEYLTHDDWLSTNPKPMLIETAIKAAEKMNGRKSISYKLGNDWPIAQRLLNESLTSAIKNQICIAFHNEKWNICPEQLADTLAALHLNFLTGLNGLSDKNTVISNARNLQCFSRAIILASLEKNNK
ncbi:TetR/AcrR family transcriptional regulator [Vibrio sp. THAF190c]|uniref:TetR/AcrR family transcriptional regulator n=1 Tax=Vibrio sp. THAF190c TaxID=2587865 RepID=UPI001267B1E2|nr:TetR/AcrR family transcriptional regulator [Vibrio sp. THAF190c]QFT11497.1 hypothetical protein FIV04_16375 [Vibrio sp. THAF190c]